VLLNRLEFLLMNNPVRAAVQRHFEAPRFLRLAGRMNGGRALEIGCGRGVGVQLILELMGADAVDGFDLDPRMVALARERLRRDTSRVRLWVGDATAVPVPDGRYDAVFDFGIIHHVPSWRLALREVARVLKPTGRFYAEEVLESVIGHPIARRLLDHPRTDRFDADRFEAAVREAGLTVTGSRRMGRLMVWLAARKPAADDRIHGHR
jgi:ubiquinone/menaquinone biosynthesis C-methylase UbiE